MDKIPQNQPCLVCGATGREPLYRGPIRVGKFPARTPGGETVWRCGDCGIGWYPGALDDYESAAYRELVDGSEETGAYHRTHDPDLPRHWQMTAGINLRGQTIADIGCGGGSFLNAVEGVAKTLVAVEPTAAYHAELERRGYAVFSYTEDAFSRFEGKIDLATSFSVIEHVGDPLAFLGDIRRLLRPGGRLILSTPNRDDWLVSFSPAYAAFFYRVVHRWYFDRPSLEETARRAGFSSCDVHFLQRFGHQNALRWLRDERPIGHRGDEALLPALDGIYESATEQSGQSDYLWAVVTA